MKLWQINDGIDEAFRALSEEEQELSAEEYNDLVQKISELSIDRDKKIEGVCCLIKNSLAESEMLYEEEKKLQNRRKIKENKAESLKNYLRMCLEDGERFETAKAKINWRKSKQVEILKPDAIPDSYLRIVSHPNLTEIKKAIESGESLDFAILIDKNNLSVS